MSLRNLFSLLRVPVVRNVLTRAKHNEANLVVFDHFQKVPTKNKNAYIDLIRMFESNDIRRRGHVEFIYVALRNMEEFGVHKDLEAYKTLLDVLPKGRFVPQNILQAEFMHFPKQQQCAVDLLEQMEDNKVMPDFEMEDTLLNIFGRRGIPLRKFWRMMYWMPKFRNLSPWRLPQKMPDGVIELAQLAIERISSVDIDTQITIFQTENVEDSIDNTWIVSAQSPVQLALVAREAEERALQSPEDPSLEPLVVRGPFKVYLREYSVTYFTLTGPVRAHKKNTEDIDDVSQLKLPNIFGSIGLPALKPSIHEQDDGTVLAICATGTSSRDSLLSWIRLLEKNGNPGLANLPVIFTLTAPSSELSIPDTQLSTTE